MTNEYRFSQTTTIENFQSFKCTIWMVSCLKNTSKTNTLIYTKYSRSLSPIMCCVYSISIISTLCSLSCQFIGYTPLKWMPPWNKARHHEGYYVSWSCFREVLIQLHGHFGGCCLGCCCVVFYQEVFYCYKWGRQNTKNTFQYSTSASQMTKKFEWESL